MNFLSDSTFCRTQNRFGRPWKSSRPTRLLAGSEACLAGSKACLAGSWALEGGTNEWTNERMDERKISPFYRTLSPIGGAAPLQPKNCIKQGKGTTDHMMPLGARFLFTIMILAYSIGSCTLWNDWNYFRYFWPTLGMDKGKCGYVGCISGWFWGLRVAPRVTDGWVRVSGYRLGRRKWQRGF